MKIAALFLKTFVLIHFKPMVGEWHFASKNQLPGLSLNATAAGNELIQQITFHILITW